MSCLEFMLGCVGLGSSSLCQDALGLAHAVTSLLGLSREAMKLLQPVDGGTWARKELEGSITYSLDLLYCRSAVV